MLKIGEFSQLGQVTVRTLRLYDDLVLLKPTFIDPASGYRYYDITQLPRLNRIVALKDLGLRLEQIAQVLNDALSPDKLRGMLELRQAESAQRINEERSILLRVAARLRMIEREGQVSPYEVVRKVLPAFTVASIRTTVPALRDMAAYRCSLYDEIYAWLAQRHITPCGYEFALYHDPRFEEQDIDMELGVIVPASARGMSGARVQIADLPPAEQVASVVHQGDIWDIPQALVALYTWAALMVRSRSVRTASFTWQAKKMTSRISLMSS